MSTSKKTIAAIRKDFPILRQRMHGKALAYLDNAATTQKPSVVIDAEAMFYRTMNANVHRGIYDLAERATAAYEGTRDTVRDFLGARKREEIIFTRGTTEAINLVAQTWGKEHIRRGDAIVVTEMEHHSNLVPWQQLALAVGAELRFVPVTDEGRLDVASFPTLIDDKVKLVAVTALSNVLGTVTPLKAISKRAHDVGAVVLIDAAQAAAHMPINVQSLDCDFLALSSHKLYGPTGVGILYGKEALLTAMPPYQFGGDMILEVHKDRSTWNELPYKFEAGTTNIAGIVAFGEAIRYVRAVGWDWIAHHESMLTDHLLKVLGTLSGVTLYGPADGIDRAGVASFAVEGIHPHDLATVFDAEGIAIRSGHHCAQVLMERFRVPALARASIALYNTIEEIDRIPQAIDRARSILGPQT